MLVNKTKYENEISRFFKEELVYKDDRFRDRSDLFKTVAKDLVSKGYVKNSFLDKLNEREDDYPTGLPGKINVAFPHTDPEFINQEFIAVALLKEPIEFIQMATEDTKLSVEAVFILGYKKGKDQVKILQLLIDNFILEEGIEKIKKETDKNSIVRWLKVNIEDKIT